MKELNMCIQCDRCLKFQELSNRYKTISIFYEDYFSCCLCRYKSVYDISDIKYINHFIIDFYDDNSGLTKPPKYLKEKEKQMYNYLYDIIHFFYNKYNIYISEFNYSGINDKDYKNDVFSKILNNTKYNNLNIIK